MQIFSLLDILLIVYLASIFLLRWSGKPALFGGIFLLIFVWVVTKTHLGWDMAELYVFAWWFIVGGVILLIREYFVQIKVRAFGSVRTIKYFIDQSRWQKFDYKLVKKIPEVLVLYCKKVLDPVPKLARWYGAGFARTIKKVVLLIYKTVVSRTLMIWSWFRSLPMMVQSKIAVLMVVTVLLLLTTQIALLNIFLILYLIAGILFSIDSRLAFGAALVHLVAIPLLLIVKKDGWAEGVAVYVYYFLVIGVVHSIAELRREEKKDPSLSLRSGSG